MNICRICMATANNLISIVSHYDDCAEKGDAQDRFEDCFGIKVDAFPDYQKICIDCDAQLTYFYKFKRQAIKTHDHLKHQLENKPNAIELTKQISHNINETANDKNFPFTLFAVECLNEDKDDMQIKEEITEHLSDNGESDKTDEAEYFDIDWQNRQDIKSDAKIKKYKYQCEQCHRSFRNITTYTAHTNVHKGLPAYKCDICDKNFKFRVNYEYHMKNHYNSREFQCKVCDKRFLCQWDLKIHLRVHDNIRPYVCDLCGKGFRVRSHMTDHRETHNEKNTYECPICLQKYKTKATLRLHVASIHVKANVYICQHCKRTFNRKYHLDVHLKTHEKGK